MYYPVARQKLEFKPQGRSLELCLRTTELGGAGGGRGEEGSRAREACASVCERVIDFGGPQESSQTTETSLSGHPSAPLLSPPSARSKDTSRGSAARRTYNRAAGARPVPARTRERVSRNAQIPNSVFFLFGSCTGTKSSAVPCLTFTESVTRVPRS